MDKQPDLLQTERLVLRPFHPHHLPDLHKMYSDGPTMRFMPSLPHANIAATERALADDMRHPDAQLWVICLKETDEAIGVVNYLGGTRIPGMGYIIRRDFWGQGITVEACRAALGYGFDKLGHDRVELWIDQTNFASQRVAQKLNFRLKGRIPLKYAHEEKEHIMQIYGLWAHEWRGLPQPERPAKFYRTEPVLLVHDVGETAALYHRLSLRRSTRARRHLAGGLDGQRRGAPAVHGAARAGARAVWLCVHFCESGY